MRLTKPMRSLGLLFFTCTVFLAMCRPKLDESTEREWSTLRKLYDASLVYYDSSETRTFPESALLEPGAVDSRGSATHPTWLALNFETRSPSEFGYSYWSSGTRSDAEFEVCAFRDTSDSDVPVLIGMRRVVVPGGEVPFATHLFASDEALFPRGCGDDEFGLYFCEVVEIGDEGVVHRDNRAFIERTAAWTF